jgi:hypothetical protein
MRPGPSSNTRRAKAGKKTRPKEYLATAVRYVEQQYSGKKAYELDA